MTPSREYVAAQVRNLASAYQKCLKNMVPIFVGICAALFSGAMNCLPPTPLWHPVRRPVLRLSFTAITDNVMLRKEFANKRWRLCAIIYWFMCLVYSCNSVYICNPMIIIYNWSEHNRTLAQTIMIYIRHGLLYNCLFSWLRAASTNCKWHCKWNWYWCGKYSILCLPWLQLHSGGKRL